jgi:hypothetical protein
MTMDHAAQAIDALLLLELEQLFDSERLGLVDQPAHLHRPRRDFEILGKHGHVFLVQRKFVKVVVIRDRVERGQLVAQFIGIFARGG